MTPPKRRAKSRLNQNTLQKNDFVGTFAKTKKSKQKINFLIWQKLIPLLYFTIGVTTGLYILFFVQPTSIRNIPVPDSYGPLLASAGFTVYGLFKFFLKSKVISLILMFIILALFSLRLQNFS